jgi:hypothetical protein
LKDSKKLTVNSEQSRKMITGVLRLRMLLRMRAGVSNSKGPDAECAEGAEFRRGKHSWDGRMTAGMRRRR